MERHFGGNPRQRLHQEVGCTHPGLDRAEGMLDRFATLTHLLRMLVEPALDRLRDCDACLLARRDLLAVEVAAVGDRFELVRLQSCLRVLCDGREL